MHFEVGLDDAHQLAGLKGYLVQPMPELCILWSTAELHQEGSQFCNVSLQCKPDPQANLCSLLLAVTGVNKYLGQFL